MGAVPLQCWPCTRSTLRSNCRNRRSSQAEGNLKGHPGPAGRTYLPLLLQHDEAERGVPQDELPGGGQPHDSRTDHRYVERAAKTRGTGVSAVNARRGRAVPEIPYRPGPHGARRPRPHLRCRT